MTANVRETQVLVVGGGGAGLAASVILADLGIHAITIERHPSTSMLPKAHTIHVRTLEILRRHGIADDFYAASTPEENYQATCWYTSLGGGQLGDGRVFHRCDAWGGGHLKPLWEQASPCRPGNLPQRQLEPLLREHAERRTLGEVLFDHELVSCGQDENGVVATVLDRERDDAYEIRADYLIGADGGKMVGPSLGIEMNGPEPFVSMISIVIRADLSAYLHEDDAQVRLLCRPLPDGTWIRGGLVCMGPDRWDRHAREWRVSVTLPIGQAHDRQYDEKWAREAVRRQLGLPELDLDVDMITPWVLESVLADRYQVGRMFIVGDAAHRHSPMGGLGLNTGIQDVHNLTWKLAATLHGHAGSQLPDTYELERRPIGKRNMEWATLNFFNHMAAASGFGLVPGAPEERNREVIESLWAETPDGEARRRRLQEYYWTARREFEELDVELGFDYAESPVVVPDGSPAPPRDPTGHVYTPVARPGHRLPHAWLEQDGRPISTHDLIRPGAFALLTGPGAAGRSWLLAAEEVGSAGGVPVDGHVIGAELDDPDGAWQRLCGHDPDGAVLVRPDGHVAFRAATACANPGEELRRALGTALARESAELVASST